MDIVFIEIKKMLKPMAIMSLSLYLVFSLFGYYQINTFLCIIFGAIYSLINFAMIGASLVVSLGKSPLKAQAYTTFNYIIRLIITGSIIYYSITLDFLNPLAIVLPMFFPKILLVYVWGFKNQEKGRGIFGRN